jgi:hypothetical protein
MVQRPRRRTVGAPRKHLSVGTSWGAAPDRRRRSGGEPRSTPDLRTPLPGLRRMPPGIGRRPAHRIHREDRDHSSLPRAQSKRVPDLHHNVPPRAIEESAAKPDHGSRASRGVPGGRPPDLRDPVSSCAIGCRHAEHTKWQPRQSGGAGGSPPCTINSVRSARHGGTCGVRWNGRELPSPSLRIPAVRLPGRR